MDTNQLKYFVKLCEKGSFNAAARELFMSTPALRQQINSLEGSVGFKLFVRSPKGVELTGEGERFYAGSVDILSEIDDLVRDSKNNVASQRLRAGYVRTSRSGFSGSCAWNSSRHIHK